MIVVDASVIAAFVMRTPLTGLATEAAEQDDWTAPILWRSEVRSALVKSVRAGILAIDDAQRMFANAEQRMWWHEKSVRGNKVLEYAAGSKASAYDCEYVVLADDLGLKLVTVDRPLVVHFPKTAIHLEDYLASRRAE